MSRTRFTTLEIAKATNRLEGLANRLLDSADPLSPREWTDTAIRLAEETRRLFGIKGALIEPEDRIATRKDGSPSEHGTGE